jgi:hypothetical protein
LFSCFRPQNGSFSTLLCEFFDLKVVFSALKFEL